MITAIIAITLVSCKIYKGNLVNLDKLMYMELSPILKGQDIIKNSRHIRLKYKFPSDTQIIGDERKLFYSMAQTKKARIKFLNEYFAFYGDTTISDKRFPDMYGSRIGKNRINDEKIQFTIEVEALYSLTTMLIKENIVISPVLINKKTGYICNFRQKDITNVYKIYQNWFSKMKNNNFLNITYPLEDSNYEWLGEGSKEYMNNNILKSL
ncbi:hypothetical protein [Sphingobacterium faecium]